MEVSTETTESLTAKTNATPEPEASLRLESLESRTLLTPVFFPSEITTSVVENADLGTFVTDVDATSGTTYEIISGNEMGEFEIDSETGVITVAGSIDYEMTSQFTLEGEGDNGCGTAIATVTVNVTDVEPPAITRDQGFSIDEDAAIDTVIGTVALDVAMSNVTFTIMDGNAGGEFAIDAETGELTVNGELDYEVQTAFGLTIEASDSEGSDFALVTIDINNVEEAPEILTYTAFEVSPGIYLIEGDVNDEEVETVTVTMGGVINKTAQVDTWGHFEVLTEYLTEAEVEWIGQAPAEAIDHLGLISDLMWIAV